MFGPKTKKKKMQFLTTSAKAKLRLVQKPKMIKQNSLEILLLARATRYELMIEPEMPAVQYTRAKIMPPKAQAIP